MAHFIQRLAGIGRGELAKHQATDEQWLVDDVDIEQLKRALPDLRDTLAIPAEFSNDALLASLLFIARHPTEETRWHAAEASTLGQYLAGNGRDMHRTLVALLSLLPEPTL